MLSLTVRIGGFVMPYLVFQSIGPAELLIILGIVIVLFGAGRIAGIGSALGSSIRSFRRELKEPENAEEAKKQAETGTSSDSTEKKSQSD